MRQLYLLLIGISVFVTARSQNPATVFTIPNRTINLPCGSSGCTSFSAQVPHIKQTTDYVLTRPAYVPFAYSTPTGNELTAIYSDDMFSSLINLPFPFCFYGNQYNSLVMGSNAIITFDATTAGQANSWPLTTSGGSGTPVPIPYAGGTQNSSFSTYYPKASIMGPYHDIYPTLTAGGQRKIEWRIEGVAPKRRFIGSYNVVPMFSCTSTNATSQIVIYEGTGIVEVYVHDKPICTGWNSGLAILGIQNFERDKAVAADGKNATVWGGLNIDSCYRFVPSGSTSRFVSAAIYNNGVFVANADTSTAAAGVLNLNWPNVCPTSDSTAYELRVTFSPCGSSQATVFSDTIYVKKKSVNVSVTKVDATCTGGSITINASSGTSPYQYSINGGNTYQAYNVFTGVSSGTYNVVVKDALNCTSNSQQITLALTNNLTVSASTTGTICGGQSYTPNFTSNATSFSWSPTTGVSNPTSLNPTFSPTSTTTYTLTATLGSCTAQRTATITVTPGAVANAGPDAIIIAGDSYQMQASASAGTYTWTSSLGGGTISTILNPVVTPTATSVYTLRVTTPQGCTASDDVLLTVIPYCIKPMEAFTPNGDGINDRWLITNGSCLTAAKAQVYNRYGSKVFESNDYKNTWEGTYEGKPLPDGTYYYVISFQLLNGKQVILKGNVTILR
jgi:gliding motility-associated-like protein